ncbi:MAG: hypothetical protein AAGA96_03285 [Verrucomicrobiota bacterium]
MKHIPRTSGQRGFISGRFAFLLIVFAIGFMVKNQMSTGSVSGQTAATIQAEMGQPITTKQIPRPN